MGHREEGKEEEEGKSGEEGTAASFENTSTLSGAQMIQVPNVCLFYVVYWLIGAYLIKVPYVCLFDVIG